MLQLFWKGVVDLSAGFVGDKEQLKSYEGGKGRNVGRVIVAALGALAFLTMLVLFVTIYSSSSRTDRNYADKTQAGSNKKTFHFTDEDGDKYFRDKITSICVCTRLNINWPDYVAFFPVEKISGQIRRMQNITNGEDFCSHLPVYKELGGCKLMVNSVVLNNISQTCLADSSLMGPQQLNDTIASRVLGNLDQILWNYDILRAVNVSATSETYDKMESLYNVWRAMISQFQDNHTSTDEDYWTSAEKNNVLNVIGNNTALGMSISWPIYANECAPSYCDIVKQSSTLYRAFIAIVQVGGFYTILVGAVRFFIWPSLRKLSGWEVDHGSKVHSYS